MRKSITSSLAMAMVMSALAPMALFAQNATPTIPAAPKAAVQSVNPTGATMTNRAMANRNGKWRHRNHHKNMYWRNAANNPAAMRSGGMATAGGMYRPTNSAVTGAAVAKTNTNAATSTATAVGKTHHSRHHKATVDKSKSTSNSATRAATQASKSKAPPKAKNVA